MTDTPVPPAPNGPLVLLHHAVEDAQHFGATWWPILVTSTTAALLMSASVRTVKRRRHVQGMVRDARLIRILIPPKVEPASGAAFWAHLHGLLRPAWRRWWSGQPHLSFEFAFSSAGVRIAIWVPGCVPPGLVERAIEAAWPGAQTEVEVPAASALPEPRSC